MEYYGNNDWRDYLAHYGVKGMEWGKHKFGDDEKGHSRAYVRALRRYKSTIKAAKKAGLTSKRSRKRTQFGNIDLNNRAVLNWDDKNLKKYKNELSSYGYKSKDLKGSVSTVMGESRSYNGLEIAFSPLVQKKGKAILLNSKTVDEYIGKLMDKMRKEKGDWTTEDLLKADKKGMKIGKQKVQSIIADVGNTAIKTGEQMHFLGKDGAINLAKRDVKKAAKQEKHAKAKQILKVAKEIIRGNYGSGSKRRKKLTKKYGDWKVYQNKVNELLGSKKRHR